jgi:hypothetical protein
MAGGPRIQWPNELKHTGTRDRWFERFAKLKPGLSLQEVSRLLSESYASVYRWADVFEYPFPDLRRQGRVSSDEWEKADWAQRDADIARALGVSRERVRQVRAARGIGPSTHRATVQRFMRWAKGHRVKLHGIPVAEALRSFGDELSPQVARRVLRLAGVRPHDPGSRWREVDWRLPNRDLARLWNTSAKYVANIRARLKAGPAQWDAPRGKLNGNGRYQQALSLEKQRARSARALHGGARKRELVNAG